MPHQVDHFEKISNILTDNPTTIDVSDAGSGKTYTTMKIFEVFNFSHAVVISEVTILESNWKVLTGKMGIRDKFTFVSFGSMSGRVGKTPGHGLLERKEDPKKGSIFSPTDSFRKMAEEGMLLIIDECSAVKNHDTARTKAVISLIDVIKRSNNSRVIYLSATPFEKIKQTISFLKLMGILGSDDLLGYYNPGTGRYVPTGITQLYDFAIAIDPLAKKYVAKLVYSGRNCFYKIAFDIFTQFILPKISSRMAMPEISKEISNGFYNMGRNDEEIKQSLLMLAEELNYSNGEIVANRLKEDSGKIFQLMHRIELLKTPKIIELALDKLMENETNKVIIMISYNDTLDMIDKYFENLGVNTDPNGGVTYAVLNGATKGSDREDIITTFNGPDNTIRLLICNMKVCSKGLSLGDCDGGFPRTIYAMPNHSFETMYQSASRVGRVGEKSSAIVRFIYSGKMGELEMGIINALYNKSKTMEKIIGSEEVFYPCKYGMFFEEGVKPFKLDHDEDREASDNDQEESDSEAEDGD